ncbi:MAG: ABC transporter substrate-binding protein [Bacteroidota bacterium]
MGIKKSNLYIKSIFWILMAFSLYGCNTKRNIDESESAPSNTAFEDRIIPKYASKFHVTYGKGFKYVEIPEPYKGAGQGLKYLLVPKGTEAPDSITTIKIPIETMVCTSTTHIPFLDMLEEVGKLTGFPNTGLVSNEKVNNGVEKGEIVELGLKDQLNVETLLNLAPSTVFAYTYNAQNQNLDNITKAGIPVVFTAEYLEETPLGRAEWIKFISLFFNKEKEADSIFTAVEEKYLNLQSIATAVEKKPTVFTGIDYNGTWYMPGGNSFIGNWLADAGAQYLWHSDQQSGSLPLSFETVYDRAYQADYWLNISTFNTREELSQSDDRYQKFKAFETGQLYNYSVRINENGGNDYFEAGVARPDIVLKDLIKIFHPDLLPDHKLYFYQKLK